MCTEYTLGVEEREMKNESRQLSYTHGYEQGKAVMALVCEFMSLLSVDLT